MSLLPFAVINDDTVEASKAMRALVNTFDDLIRAEDDPAAVAALLDLLEARARRAAPHLIALLVGDLLNGAGQLLETHRHLPVERAIGLVDGVAGVLDGTARVVQGTDVAHDDSPLRSGPDAVTSDAPATTVAETPDASTSSEGDGAAAGTGGCGPSVPARPDSANGESAKRCGQHPDGPTDPCPACRDARHRITVVNNYQDGSRA